LTFERIAPSQESIPFTLASSAGTPARREHPELVSGLEVLRQVGAGEASALEVVRRDDGGLALPGGYVVVHEDDLDALFLALTSAGTTAGLVGVMAMPFTPPATMS
jgi:hypothetical protein